jgi:DNA-binding transcriptional LysR family regulator
MDSLEQVAALKDGRIDVGFDRIIVDDPLIVHMALREEPLVAALPRQNALVARGKVRLEDVTSLPLIVYPGAPRPSYADLILSFFHERNLVLPKVIEVRELQTALLMVASGGGVCIIPESVRRLARSDIGYAGIDEPITVPFLLRRRTGGMSENLQRLLSLYDPA